MKRYFGLAAAILASLILSGTAHANSGHHSGGFHSGSHFGSSHGHFAHHHHGHSAFYFGLPFYGAAAFYGSPYYYGGYGYGYGSPYYGYAPGPYGAGVYDGRRGRQSFAAAVQYTLAEEGYYRGRIDGVIGEGTRLAIRSYQRRNRLPITGRIDNPLVQSLGI